MAEKLTELEAIPQEFKDASIIHLYKRKDIHKSVTTTEASPSYALLGRYWPPECSS